MTEFWMVWGQGNRAPAKVHDTLESAIEEATRLAGASDGHYYALKAVGYARRPTPPVAYIECPCGGGE